MKIRPLLFTLLAFVLLGTIASCKKEDNKSKTQLLTSGSWKVVAHTATSGSVTIDAYKEMKDCEKDDFLVFDANGTVTFNEGAVKCENDDDQTSTSTWKFTDNETKITFDDSSATILSLTGSEFKVTYTETINGKTVTGIITFKH